MRTMCNVPISQIKPNPRNARTHSKKQIRQIASSIREFGWASPLMIDEDGLLLAGHGRLAAAELLGLTAVPVVVVNGLTAAGGRAFAIADNRLPENAGFDQLELAHRSFATRRPRLRACRLVHRPCPTRRSYGT